jgi:GDP-L-fucose synthase
VAGERTLIGSAIRRRLEADGYRNLVGGPGEPDWTDVSEVRRFFAAQRPAYVFLAAGRSGGIRANGRFPAELMRHNLLADCHVIHSAHDHGTKKLVYVASSCVYPRECPQPMRVEALWSGPLEPTNAAYATAKLAGMALCQAYARQYGARFISAIPANPFGPGDHFHPEEAHVIPGLMNRMHRAKLDAQDSVAVWGTGAPRREFIFVEDLAEACILLMGEYDDARPINLGGGYVRSIQEVAEAVAGVVGYRGAVRFDSTKPDGMPVKVLDCTPLQHLGWRPTTPFGSALARTYDWLLATGQAGGVRHG